MYHKLIKTFVYSVLTMCGLIGLTSLVWAQIRTGSPVLYTAPDTATVPILISPDLRSTGAFSATGSLLFSGFVSPTQLTGNVNDYSPTGFATSSVLRLTGNAAWTLTGLIAAPHGTWKVLYNVGSFPITLASESASSAAANRFALTGNLVVPAGAGVHLQYDQTATPGRWRSASRTFLITSPLAIQNLGSGSIVQHSGRTDAIEIVRIQSAGGTPTNGTNPRILAGADGQLILLTGMSATLTYTIPDGNGVKWSTGSSVLFDDRASRLMEYQLDIGAWREAVTGAGGGGGGGGTAASTSFNPTGGIGATNVQTALAELDSEAEKLANKNVNNGYLGLNSTGDATWDRKDSFLALPALSVSSQIDANTSQVTTLGIQGNTTAVTLSSGTPRITGCTTATGGTGRNGTRLVLRGTHPTFTVTIPTGQGVQLAGNTGSVIVGSLLSPVEFQCDETAQLWVQINVPSAQQVYNVGRTVNIYTCGNALNPLWDGGGGTTMEFCLDAGGSPTWKALVAGSPTDSIVQLSSGKKFCVMKSDLTTQLFCVNDSGAVSGLSAQQAITGNQVNANATCSSGGDIHWYALNGRSGGDVAGGYTVARIAQPWPIAQTLTRLRVQHDTGFTWPGGGTTATYTIYKNGAVASGLSSCAVTSSATPCTVTGSISVAQNDLMALQMVCTGSSGPVGASAWGIAAQ